MNSLETQVLTLPEQANLIKIVDEDSFKKSGDFLVTIKKFRKEIDESYDPIIKKAHESHKEAVAQKKKIEAPLVQAESIIKKALSEYYAQIEKKRKEEEERLRLEAKKIQEEMILKQAMEAEKKGQNEQCDKILNETPKEIKVMVKPIEKAQGVSFRKTWKFKIVNPDLVPLEYRIIDQAKIGSKVRELAEKTNIPGVEVFEETSASYNGRGGFI